VTSPVGRFSVGATEAEVETFRAAIRLTAADDGQPLTLPLTFPMRWMVKPEIRTALLAFVPEPDLVLVHESQTFAYHRTLRVDETFDLTLTAARESSPDRLRVDGQLMDADGIECARLETILRLFSTGGAA
jgi:hypothetical protein